MKNLLTTMLILGAIWGHHVFGQVIPQPLLTIIDSSAYIFEGEVIRSESYWTDDHNFIYTSATVEISKIFKGNLVCGTIEVLTAGGRIANTELEITHNLELSVGEIGLFFGNITNWEQPPIDYYPESNTEVIDVTFSEQGFYKYYYDEVNPEVASSTYNFDSLAQVYDVVEYYTQLNYTDCNAASSIQLPSHDEDYYRRRRMRREGFITFTPPNAEMVEYVDPYQSILDRKLAQVVPTRATGDTIEYRFGNIVFNENAVPQTLEFDILIRANDNTTYFDNGSAHIELDPTIFGNDAATNGRVTVSRGNLISSSSNYLAPAVTDVSSTAIAISMSADLNAQNRSQLTINPQQAVRVSIEVLDCTREAILFFTNPANMLAVSLYTTSPSGSSLFGFGNLKAASIGQSNLCLPTITDVSPDIVHGGLGEIITITGQNFGANQGNGRVFLFNADDFGATSVALDSRDMVSWSDNQIQVRVPSIVDTITIDGFTYKGTPGSGPVEVVNDAGESSFSSNPVAIYNAFVNITYSVRNYELNNQKVRADLISTFGSGGYRFYPNATLLNDAAGFAVVKKAIADWVCYSNANFQISDTALAVATIIDDQNTIRFGQTLASTVMGQTTLWKENCLPSSRIVQPEVDIVLKHPNNWWYDTLSFATHPAGTFDLYQVVLHELGHAHLLNHVNDSLAVLYWTSHSVVSNRAIDLYTDSSVVGVFPVLQHSTGALGCNLDNMVLLPPCVANSIASPASNAQIKVFPNPGFDHIYIQFDILPTQPIHLTLFDATGQEIKSERVNPSGRLELSVRDYPTGIYFLTIEVTDKVYFQKIIKQ